MSTLLIGPIYLTYEKIKEHRDGKRKIRNIARYEDLRREHEGILDSRDSHEARLDQERMRTGFAIPEMGADGRVKISHDWEEERARQWEERQRQLDYERFRAASLRPQQTGSRGPSMGSARESMHGDYRSRVGSLDMDRNRSSPVPRRSLQVGRTGYGYDSNESLSGRSRGSGSLEPHTMEVPKQREEEPKDMSSLFIDDILRERGLAR